MPHPQNVAINADYLTLVRRYAELAGMSAKSAIEYAIDRTLVPELAEYTLYDEDEDEISALTKAANDLLPEGWAFSVMNFPESEEIPDTDLDILMDIFMDISNRPNATGAAFDKLYPSPKPRVLIGIHFWQDDEDELTSPTFLTIDEAQGFSTSLLDLSQSSGSKFVVGGKNSGDPFKVRRAGRGIRLELLDRATGEPTGKFSTIAANRAASICLAIENAIKAARIGEERENNAIAMLEGGAS